MRMLTETLHIEILMHIFINVLLEVQSSVLERMGWGWGEVTSYRQVWSLDGHAHALMMRRASKGCLPSAGVPWSSFHEKSERNGTPTFEEKELFFFFFKPETGELLFSWTNGVLLFFNIALDRLFNGQTFWGARGEGARINSIEMWIALRGDLNKDFQRMLKKMDSSLTQDCRRGMFHLD